MIQSGGALRQDYVEGEAPPICESRTALAIEVDAWLRTAKPGERFVYCSGPVLVRGAAAEKARQLYEAGAVDLCQVRRRDCSGFDYVLIRRSPAKAAAAPAAEEDPALDLILRELKRCANFGLRCPSDTELARRAGLATRNQASWRLQKLIQAGAIRSKSVTSGADAGWRVVTIVKTGRETAVPPSWAAFRKSMREPG